MAVDPTKLKAKRRPLAVVDEDGCSGCMVCVYFCPVANCILPVSAPGGEPWEMVVRVAPERCIGCSLCAQFCPWGVIQMADASRREEAGKHDSCAMAQH